MQTNRRRELVSALTTNAADLIELLLNLLQEHTQKAEALVSIFHIILILSVSKEKSCNCDH